MKEKGEEEGERKERDIYIYNLQVSPSCLRCCFFETTRAAFMCLYILYIHISAYTHTHLQAHSLMRALTLSCARTRARTRMHMYTTHTGARAQTRIHPMRPHNVHAWIRTRHMHACTRTMLIHAYVRARANTPAHTPALV